MTYRPLLCVASFTAVLLTACATPRSAAPPPVKTEALAAEVSAKPAAAAAPAPVTPAWEGATFKVCADPNNPPYSDKTLGGYENKIAALLATALGKKVEYFWFPQRMGFIRNTLKAQLADSGEYRCDVIMGYPTGADMVATTKPYYRSTYAIVYVKGRGFDDIRSPADLANLATERRQQLKLAMFDASPASTWLLKHGLVEYALPYQTMTGDGATNTAQTLEKDMKAGKLDMAIIWGPIAGWLQYHAKIGPLTIIPLQAEDDDKEARFEYPMSMAVRIPDKARKAMLDQLIAQKAGEIRKILQAYSVPLVEAGKGP